MERTQRITHRPSSLLPTATLANLVVWNPGHRHVSPLRFRPTTHCVACATITAQGWRGSHWDRAQGYRPALV